MTARRATREQCSIEAHLDSDFDGPFNFLVGGIYLDQQFTDANYYVASFGLDYAAGILGAATALGQRAAGNVAFPNVFLAPPFFNSEVNLFKLESYGLFGEVYWDASDELRFTGGLRYSNDKQARSVARVPILSWPMPYGITDANNRRSSAASTPTPRSPATSSMTTPRATFDEFTGRLVVEYQLHRRQHGLCFLFAGLQIGRHQPAGRARYSRCRAPSSRRSSTPSRSARRTAFDGGRFRLNLSAFYYDYSGLQLSRIVARTSVNDNTDAEVYGAELEGLFRPNRDLLINFSASYLHSQDRAICSLSIRATSPAAAPTR